MEKFYPLSFGFIALLSLLFTHCSGEISRFQIGRYIPALNVCPSGNVLCLDGVCRTSCEDGCPSGQVRCTDGQCKATCSSARTNCPTGQTLCPDGQCKATCSSARTNCPTGQTLCPDGQCKVSCGGGTGCPTGQTLCLDGQCRASCGGGVNIGTVPADHKVAIMGDHGSGSSVTSVLNMIKAQGSNVLLINGDLDYGASPSSEEQILQPIIAAGIPIFAVIGNHDTSAWNGASGYGALFVKHLRNKPDVQCSIVGNNSDNFGRQSYCDHKGIRYCLMATKATGVSEATGGAFIETQCGNTSSPWVITSFHHNMAKVTCGSKGDEAGWTPFEKARIIGSPVTNGHDHCYSRTVMLTNMAAQTPAPAPNTTSHYELVRGQSFVTVVGTGGRNLDAYSSKGSYMIAGYGGYGALICTFNPGGVDPKRAECKFLTPAGAVKDSFTMTSKR